MIRSFVYFIVVFFGVVIAIPMVYMALSGFNDAVQDSTHFPTVAKNTMQTQADKFTTIWDYTILISFFAVAAGMLGLAWALPSNPIVVFAMMIVVTIVGLLAGYTSNAWETITSGSSSYAAAATSFTIANFLMTYYLHFTVAIGFLTLIVFYAKPNQEGVF